MTTANTFTHNNQTSAGFPPAPPEAHQRAAVAGSDPRYPFGRKWAFAQAMASARIEGYVPTEAFKAAYAEVEEGRMTGDDFRARILAGTLV